MPSKSQDQHDLWVATMAGADTGIDKKTAAEFLAADAKEGKFQNSMRDGQTHNQHKKTHDYNKK